MSTRISTKLNLPAEQADSMKTLFSLTKVRPFFINFWNNKPIRFAKNPNRTFRSSSTKFQFKFLKVWFFGLKVQVSVPTDIELPRDAIKFQKFKNFLELFGTELTKRITVMTSLKILLKPWRKTNSSWFGTYVNGFHKFCKTNRLIDFLKQILITLSPNWCRIK